MATSRRFVHSKIWNSFRNFFWHQKTKRETWLIILEREKLVESIGLSSAIGDTVLPTRDPLSSFIRSNLHPIQIVLFFFVFFSFSVDELHLNIQIGVEEFDRSETLSKEKEAFPTIPWLFWEIGSFYPAPFAMEMNLKVPRHLFSCPAWTLFQTFLLFSTILHTQLSSPYG
jgi:hypothetical protein